MPFLRFSRDKRGYETTSLMHSFRGRGDARPRVLYWFRTPPDVKVGRAALDEEAIRALEESNPELTFDWSRILHSRAKPQPTEREPARRSERRAGGRPPRQTEIARPVRPRAALAAEPPPPRETIPPETQPPETPKAKTRRRRRRSQRIDTAQLPFPEAGRPVEATPDSDRLIARGETPAEAVPPSPGINAEPAIVEVRTSGDAEETPIAPAEIAGHVSVLEAVGHEDLARLRARYAEIKARITERVTDPQRLEKLRTLAEQLNPDGWVTAEDVASGLAEFEAVHSALRSMLGRRRRRSRRGGIRHRRGGNRPVHAGESAAPSAPEVAHPEPSRHSDSGTDDDPGRDV